jgi:hypothetical protein
MKKYHPKTEFSAELLRSIPKKVTTWLLNLGKNIDEPLILGTYGTIKVNITPEGGVISVMHRLLDIDIMWNGSPFGPSDLCGTVPNFENLEVNLPFFTLLEEVIYHELQELQDVADKQSALLTEEAVLESLRLAAIQRLAEKADTND